MSFEETRKASFWQSIYDSDDAGWDLKGPHPTLEHVLQLGLLRGFDRVLVPGAGRGHDAFRIAEAGHAVDAVDFAPAPVAHMRDRATQTGLSVAVHQSDIFDLRDWPAGSIDAVFEYTCFCAIDPSLRDSYVELVTHLVRPGGRFLMLAFPLGERVGPPHGMTIEELKQRFTAGWRWVLDAEPYTTPGPRAGRERVLVLERRHTD